VATPSWWNEVVGVSEVLADADRAEIERWRRPESEGAPDDVPPLTVRLGTLGRVYAERSTETRAQTPHPSRAQGQGRSEPGFSEAQTRELFRLLEDVLANGGAADGDAVATGFFEALLNAWDAGFDLRSVWPALGPDSRAYCRAWNDFTGVETPDWMR
jgi:hypothetical protein